MLLGLIAIWAGIVLIVKTHDGTLVLENLPENATVAVDEQKVLVTTAEGKPVEIQLKPGQHGVVIKRDGVVITGERVTIESGKDFKLVVRCDEEVPSSEEVRRDKELASNAAISKTSAAPKSTEPPTPPNVDRTKTQPAAATHFAQEPPANNKGLAKTRPEIPADAKQFAGKYYKFFKKWMTWREARKECERMGGHLVIVRNAEQNKFLRSLVRGSGIDAAWLGATDQVTEGQWIWLDGTEMDYNAWDVDWNQPDNRSREDGRAENFVILVVSREGRWLDQPLEGEKGWHPGFICQW